MSGCDLGENLAIELDVCGLELSDEATVGELVHACGCTQASLPEATHVALLFLAVSKLEGPCVKEGFFCLAELGTAGPLKALCMLEQAFAAVVCD